MTQTYKQGIGFLYLDESLDFEQEMSDEQYRNMSGIDYSDAVSKVIDSDMYKDALANLNNNDDMYGDEITQDLVMNSAGIEPKDVLWHERYNELIKNTIGQNPYIPIDGDNLYTVRSGLHDLDNVTRDKLIWDKTLCKIAAQTEGNEPVTLNGYSATDEYIFTGNTGMCFENDVFLLHAYDWGETYYGDVNVANFWHKPTGLVIDWYKYFGRGVTGNDKAIEVLKQGDFHKIIDSCYESLKHHD